MSHRAARPRSSTWAGVRSSAPGLRCGDASGQPHGRAGHRSARRAGRAAPCVARPTTRHGCATGSRRRGPRGTTRPSPESGSACASACRGSGLAQRGIRIQRSHQLVVAHRVRCHDHFIVESQTRWHVLGQFEFDGLGLDVAPRARRERDVEPERQLVIAQAWPSLGDTHVLVGSDHQVGTNRAHGCTPCRSMMTRALAVTLNLMRVPSSGTVALLLVVWLAPNQLTLDVLGLTLPHATRKPALAVLSIAMFTSTARPVTPTSTSTTALVATGPCESYTRRLGSMICMSASPAA